MMNTKAKELGMANSHFMNATGLPDPQHYSTARDLATLAVALIRDFPEDYHYFSETEFTFNNIKQGNRNPLLYRNMNVDGLKTGHTDVGGYGLTASAIRGGRRLVLVLNGMQDMQARADESAHVLDYGYREFGQSQSVALLANQDVDLTLPRAALAGLKTAIDFEQPVAAPIAKGQQLGTLTITAPGIDPKVVPLVAAENVPQLGFFARIGVKLHMMFNKA
jgi:D-alanyl-D-alanine carboxypeptidase (penicillin-binding protein 5/6)